MKLMVVEFLKINKPHNTENIIGYVVSRTLLWVKLFFCVNDKQVYYRRNIKLLVDMEQNGYSFPGGEVVGLNSVQCFVTITHSVIYLSE